MKATFVKGIGNTVRREVQRIRHRPVFVLAPLIIMVFCYVFFLTFLKEGKPTELPAGVVDLDNSYVSRTFIRNIDATQQTHIIKHYPNFTEARRDLQKGEIYGFVVIEKDFEKNLLSYRRPTLTSYVTNAYLNAGSLLMKDFSYMGSMGSAYVQMKMMDAKGENKSQEIDLVQPIALDAHLISNPWIDYGIYLLNMLLPGILQLMTILITVFVIGSEIKGGTGKKWLIASNKSMFAALTGKLIPYTLLFWILGIIGNIILFKYLHYPINGSLFAMFLDTMFLVLSSQAIGVFIIGLFNDTGFSLSIGAFFGFLGLSFSGFTFPIENMPSAARIFSFLFPLRQYFRIYANEALNGSDFRYSIIYFAILLTFCLLPVTILFKLKSTLVQPLKNK